MRSMSIAILGAVMIASISKRCLGRDSYRLGCRGDRLYNA
jgi:hypothetical protein